MNGQQYLILDYETRSEADLKAVGAFEYASHSTTEILCVAWRIGTRETLGIAPTYVWSPFLGGSQNDKLIEVLQQPKIIKVAHNALFEQFITSNVLTRYMKLDRPFIQNHLTPEYWMCTASLAAALALPRNLEGACQSIGLQKQKDMAGHRLMLKMTKPRTPTKNNPAKWHETSEDLKRLIDYCVHDIEAETELFLKLPPLSPMERKVWELNQKINLRGIRVDRELIESILKMIKEEIKYLNEETFNLTSGEVPTTKQVAKLKNWLAETQDLYLPDLRSKTISDVLATIEMTPTARRLLEIRQMVSKTSTGKYEAFEARSRSDGIVRDILLYHGASTGRDTGTGLQVQNFPRGNVKGIRDYIEILRLGDLEFIRMFHRNPMEVFSSALRSMIISREKMSVYCGDFASIEVRVLFWLADNESGLQSYREKRDLYREIATSIYKVKLSEVNKDQRDVGKRAILGSGYGMGHKKFRETCIQFDQEVSENLAQKAIEAYRTMHSSVPKMWSNLEKAAISAVRNPSKQYKINHTTWYVKDKFLWCVLPSGRKLAYYNPTVRMNETSWGAKKDTLFFWSVNPKTKQWAEDKTWGGVLTENVTQAVARDLMMEAELRLEENGYEICMAVHDELLTEHGYGNLEEFKTLMSTVPEWAEGLPVEVDAWTGNRYRKG